MVKGFNYNDSEYEIECCGSRKAERWLSYGIECLRMRILSFRVMEGW